MKRFNFFFLTLAVLFAVSFASATFAQDSTQTRTRAQTRTKAQKQLLNQNQALNQGQQAQHGYRFVDENGDGYNDNAPDADGDGIPNGLDPDYTGAKVRAGNGARGFIDLDGDGINDNALDSDGDGIPNGQDPDYVRPMDGSGARRAFGRNSNAGMGPQSGNATGNCDGTGPKGNANRKGGQK